MRRMLLAISISLMLAAKADAVRVVFEGQPPVNRRAVERLAERQLSQPDSLMALLANEGYLDAKVSLQTDRVTVVAGGRYALKSIIWVSDTNVTESVNVPFAEREVESLLDRKLLSYRSAGRMYVSAQVEEVIRDGISVTLRVRLNPGPEMRLEQVVFSGLGRTRPDILRRYIPLEAGDLLTDENLAEAERAASAVPFIDFVPPAIVKPRPGYTGADVELPFVEKKQFQFSGGGGYVPEGPAKFVWNIKANFQNLFGAGRRITLLSERREQDRQILDIAYAQPLFLIGLGEAQVDVATRDYRDLFYEFAVGASYRVRLGSDFSTGLALGWRSVEPAGNTPSYSSLSAAFSIERDNIDNRLNPSSGLSIGWTIAYSHRRYGDDSLAVQPERRVFNETRNSVSLDWFYPLVGDFVSRINLNYVGLETSESLPPVSELFYIGGPGTMRGFRNEQFTALRSAYGSIEPRLRLANGSLFVFYDAAYINNRILVSDNVIGTDEIYRYGYGLGASIIDGPRSVRLSLAWNPEVSFDQPRLSLEFLAEI